MDEKTIADFLQAAIPILTEYGIKVIGAVAILLLGRVAAGTCSKVVRSTMGRAKADKALVGFVGNLVFYAVMVFTVVAALAKFGIQTTSFVAIIGAAGLAVGFALKGSLSNFAAGVMILIFRPIRIDDVVEAGGHLGKVKDIGILNTTLASPDNRKIIIPNASITESAIVNITGNDTRRVDMTAGISYADDIGMAKEVIMKILTSHSLILEAPEPQVEMMEMADSSLNFVIRPWTKTDDYWTVYFEVMRSIKEEFDKADISIPFPQRDIHLYQKGE